MRKQIICTPYDQVTIASQSNTRISSRCERGSISFLMLCIANSKMANSTNNTEEVDDQTLMNCIQNYRVIYDKGSKDYKDQRKKKNAWSEVSLQLGIEVLEAQTRYKSIHTKFSKYIKQMRGRSGSGRCDLPPIREDLEHLRWLLVHIKHRSSTTRPLPVNCQCHLKSDFAAQRAVLAGFN